MRSQPGPNGWQLTLGGAGSTAGGCGRRWTGMAFGLDEGPADGPRSDWTSAAATPSWFEVNDSVDGEKKGPEIKEQPGALQPNAAGPTNVGLKFPRLVEAMLPFPR